MNADFVADKKCVLATDERGLTRMKNIPWPLTNADERQPRAQGVFKFNKCPKAINRKHALGMLPGKWLTVDQLINKTVSRKIISAVC